MRKLKTIVVVSFIFLIASCSLPDGNVAQRMMEKYWQFCMNEQYDSLKNFYMEGQVSEPELNQLFTGMHDLREKYGNIKKANNYQISTSKTLSEGDKIELAYQVEYEKKMLDHKFTFKKFKGDEFRIVDHNFEQ